ncbi:hypothetical protein [Nitrosomonas oligotropha]|nr:hypothetical protein [Nitrosomonas oligotropha]
MIETTDKTHTRHHRIRRGALHAPIDAPHCMHPKCADGLQPGRAQRAPTE